MDRPGTPVGVMPNVIDTGPVGTGGTAVAGVRSGVEGEPGAPGSPTPDGVAVAPDGDDVAGDGGETGRANCAGRV